MQDLTPILTSDDFKLVFICVDEPDGFIHFATTFKNRVVNIWGSDTGRMAYKYAYSDFRRLTRRGMTPRERSYFPEN